MKAFSSLLKVKAQDEFIWGEEQWQVFEHIMQVLAEPTFLVLPTPGKPLKLYISDVF